MTVTFVLHAHLARHAGGRERVTLPWREATPIAEYLAALGLPAHEFYAVVRAGRASADFAAVPAPGEEIEVLPAVSGG